MNRVPFGKIADFRAGFGFPKEFQGRTKGDYPFAKVGDISRAGRSGLSVLGTADHYVDETDLARLKLRPIPTGSTLFAKIGEAIRQEHRVMAGRPMIIDNNAMAAVPKTGVDPRYLFRLMQTIKLYDIASSTTVPSIRKSDLEVRIVSLPSSDEQRRIVDILDKADAVRAKRRKTIACLDTLSQSIFHEMFGDPLSSPKRDCVKELAELVDPQRPVTYGILMPGPDQPGGVKYIRVTDIQDGRIRQDTVRATTAEIAAKYQRSELRPGDLLMSIRGHVGRFAIVPPSLDGANITQDTARLAIVGACPIYVRECLSTPSFQHWMKRHTKGVAVRGINLADVREMPILIAPPEHQRAFAERVRSIEKLKSAHRAQLAELDALFLALQNRAFKGEL